MLGERTHIDRFRYSMLLSLFRPFQLRTGLPTRA